MATSLLSPPIGTPKTPLLHASKISFASSAPVRRWRFNSHMASAKDPNSLIASAKDPNSPIASVKDPNSPIASAKDPNSSAKDPNSPMASAKDPINEEPTDDYKNSYKYLYGLPPSQLNAVIIKQKYARPKTGSATEKSISSLEELEKEIFSYPGNVSDHFGLLRASSMSERGPPRYIMNTTLEEQQPFEFVDFPLRRLSWRGRYRGQPLPRPPDMPSHFYFDRVIFLEDPIVPEVAEHITTQFMWLDFDDDSKPIYLYINSEGNQDEDGSLLASEANAYAIADIMAACKSKVYTIHMGIADGLAALLLSLGVKGRRGVQPHSFTQLYLPKFPRSSGVATDMWSTGRGIDGSTEIFLELLSKGTGKPKEELYRDLQEPKVFTAQGAIDYGLADRIVGAQELGFGSGKKKGNSALAAKKAEVEEMRAMRRARLAESNGKAIPQAPGPSVA